MKEFLFLILCGCLAGNIALMQKPDPMLTRIETKSYNFQFVYEKGYDFTNSGERSLIKFGFIHRLNEDIYSASDSENIVGILADSDCLVVDKKLKIISFGPKNLLGSLLITPIYDPLSILEYSRKHSSSDSIVHLGTCTLYSYFFNTDTLPIKKIEIMTDRNNDSEFSIRLTYFQRAKVATESIKYSLVPSRELGNESHLDSYVIKRDGDHFLQNKVRDFTFFNSYKIMKVFK